jgi:hypothetical protein
VLKRRMKIDVMTLEFMGVKKENEDRRTGLNNEFYLSIWMSQIKNVDFFEIPSFDGASYLSCKQLSIGFRRNEIKRVPEIVIHNRITQLGKYG